MQWEYYNIFHIWWKTCPYDTTLLLILVLLVVYAIECKARVTVDQIHISRDILWNQKRFHRILLAILSHPPPSFSLSPDSHDANHSSLEISSGSEDRPSSSVAAGGSVFHHSRIPFRIPTVLPDIFLRWRASLGLHTLLRRLRPLLSSRFASGLPLLAYIIHLLWQCRHLEPLMNLAYDRTDWLSQKQVLDPYNALTHAILQSMTSVVPHSNIQDVIQQDQPLHDFLKGKCTFRDILNNSTTITGVANPTDITSNASVTPSVMPSLIQHLYHVSDWKIFITVGPFSYLRLIITVALISIILPMVLVVTATSSSTVHHNIASSTSITSAIISSWDPTFCTLSSTVISLLYLHAFYFPQANIFIVPLIPISTSNIFFKVFIPVLLLMALYRRMYENRRKDTSTNRIILGGIITAFLWHYTTGITSLATPYWGTLLWIQLSLLSILSLKASCSMNQNYNSHARNIPNLPTGEILGKKETIRRRRRRNSTQTIDDAEWREEQEEDEYEQPTVSFLSNNSWSSLVSAVFSWIDYVSWDEVGTLM